MSVVSKVPESRQTVQTGPHGERIEQPPVLREDLTGPTPEELEGRRRAPPGQVGADHHADLCGSGVGDSVSRGLEVDRRQSGQSLRAVHVSNDGAVSCAICWADGDTDRGWFNPGDSGARSHGRLQRPVRADYQAHVGDLLPGQSPRRREIRTRSLGQTTSIPPSPMALSPTITVKKT